MTTEELADLNTHINSLMWNSCWDVIDMHLSLLATTKDVEPVVINTWLRATHWQRQNLRLWTRTRDWAFGELSRRGLDPYTLLQGLI
jgi:hypothetical protein